MIYGTVAQQTINLWRQTFTPYLRRIYFRFANKNEIQQQCSIETVMHENQLVTPSIINDFEAMM